MTKVAYNIYIIQSDEEIHDLGCKGYYYQKSSYSYLHICNSGLESNIILHEQNESSTRKDAFTDISTTHATPSQLLFRYEHDLLAKMNDRPI